MTGAMVPSPKTIATAVWEQALEWGPLASLDRVTPLRSLFAGYTTAIVVLED